MSVRFFKEVSNRATLSQRRTINGQWLFDTTDESSPNYVIKVDMTSGRKDVGTTNMIDMELDKNSTNTIANMIATIEANRKLKFTYIVDSNAKLNAWVDNVGGNNYSRVLIKSGNWNYSGIGVSEFNLTATQTYYVEGENGSSISLTEMSMKYTTLNYSTSMYNVTVSNYASDSFPTFLKCANMYNCIGLCFSNCINMYGCKNTTTVPYITFNTCSNLIKTLAFGTTGYSSCSNICCGSFNSMSSGTFNGYLNCSNISKSKAILSTGTQTQTAFSGCTNISQCYTSVASDTSTTTIYGYYNCKNINESKVEFLSGNINNKTGFNGCTQISNCISVMNVGYNSCNRVENSLATNGLNGFISSGQLLNCVASGQSGAGFSLCKQVRLCKSTASTPYNNSYASYSTNASYICADISSGGFNVGTTLVKQTYGDLITYTYAQLGTKTYGQIENNT